ncbi:hypothetical protein V4841_07055 [Lelliottia amnigena]|jgi:hypothetical protein|uniref:DUF6998 domain-containing protein n=2 Tax=Enterobacteriaceae TaxID=543 RepID=A0A9J9GI86_ENT38|nr:MULTISPECIES: hypothetical protein [Enterobacter]ABP61776.1 conserved hypothetical protein [Enterobacter sp. 638]CZY23938.1 Uncharacterised protein [Enterobacter hormaechei]
METTLLSNCDDKIINILNEAKDVALRYYKLTNKPLGITGEIAEYEAATLLGLSLCSARQSGYDAIEILNGKEHRVQIKGRYMPNPKKVSARIGAIDISKPFDSVLLVLLDENYDAFEMYEASRNEVVAALIAPGSKSRNERNQLGIAKFKSISSLRWSKVTEPEIL